MIEILIEILICLLVWFLPVIIIYSFVSIDYILHSTKPVYIKDIHKEIKYLDFFDFLWVPLLNWVFVGMLFATIIYESRIIRKILGKIISFIGSIRLK